MKRVNYIFLLTLSLSFLGWSTTHISNLSFPVNAVNDTLSSILKINIDSISIEHSMKLPYGSTPSLQLYNDSLLISSFNTESHSQFDREANEFFGIEEKFFDTDIYLTDKHQDAKRLFSDIVNSPGNENNPAVSADGKLLVFSYKRNLKSRSSLYYSVYTDEQWQRRKKLIFENYKAPVSATFPSLSSQNDLYFVMASKQDSVENLDIFYAAKTAQNWAAPEKLETNINTRYNEISPVEADENLLFFASDRPGGYGGYDLYIAQKTDSIYVVSNLGPAFNTVYDDLYLLPENADLSKGYVVRYTDSVKVTPDLFSYNLYFHSKPHVLVADSSLHPAIADAQNLPTQISVELPDSNEYAVIEPAIHQYSDSLPDNLQEVQTPPFPNLVINTEPEVEIKQVETPTMKPAADYYEYVLRVELLDSEPDALIYSSQTILLEKKQLSLPSLTSNHITINVVD